MKEALIIFVRNPELGKVKTRLAAQIGDEKALNVYRKLLAHTKELAVETGTDVFVFATEALSDDYWNQFTIAQQKGDDLGQKMQSAFEAVFNKGYEKVVIIGSDCPELSCAHIQEAFQSLDEKDVVIGPAKDGGYYLLGMKKIHEKLFHNKAWSTAKVFEETITAINELQLSYKQLETLRDVDEEKDLPQSWREEFFILA